MQDVDGVLAIACRATLTDRGGYVYSNLGAALLGHALAAAGVWTMLAWSRSVCSCRSGWPRVACPSRRQCPAWRRRLAAVGVVRHSGPAARPRRAAPGSSAWGPPAVEQVGVDAQGKERLHLLEHAPWGADEAKVVLVIGTEPATGEGVVNLSAAQAVLGRRRRGGAVVCYPVSRAHLAQGHLLPKAGSVLADLPILTR
jgi:hypothetical protein